jgi:hypothetical protein
MDVWRKTEARSDLRIVHLPQMALPFPILRRTSSDIMIFLFLSDVGRRPTRFCLCASSAVGACPMLFLMYGL